MALLQKPRTVTVVEPSSRHPEESAIGKSKFDIVETVFEKKLREMNEKKAKADPKRDGSNISIKIAKEKPMSVKS